MNRSEAVEKFYTTWTWRKCRKAFAESKGNLCERCLKRGIIEAGSKDRPLEVHHKTPLTDENYKDPKVSLNWENLELLCKTCHEKEKERTPKRWRIAPDGAVTIPPGDGAGAPRAQGPGEDKKSAPGRGGRASTGAR